jgi:hypothetical protein
VLRFGSEGVRLASGWPWCADVRNIGPAYAVCSLPDGGGRMQRRYERPPLFFMGVQGEHLLELVHHQHQPPLSQLGRGVRLLGHAGMLS